jgi:TRAP transporter TAXI family solute receptor
VKPFPRRWLLAAAALVIFVALALVVAKALGGPSWPKQVRMATGQRGGTFLPLGETLSTGFAHDLAGTRFTALESPGGLASIAMLENGEAELALLSNHVRGASSLQLIAPLYEETLQIVVRSEAGIDTPHELVGKRVSVGADGSGTESIAEAILQHFGIADDALDRRNMALSDAVTALEAGQLDAAFIVAGMRTPAVDKLLRRGDMALLSLGEPGRVGSALEGIRLDAPFFALTAIPEHAYGRQPTAPVGTISVRALLVARGELDEDLVFAITESLFSHKVELSQQERLLSHLTERFDLALSPYPLHPGADRYYRRDEPTVVQKYINEISLALTIGALLWSAVTAFRAARRQAHRSRIETHYQRARAISESAGGGDSHEQLQEVRAQLVAARERALGELADEMLDANEGYLILQDYLSSRIAEIDRLLAVARRASA